MKNFIDSYKKFPIQVKASFWFLISSFLQKGISVISTPIFTRLLSTSDYGQYSVFNSWLGIVTVFVSLNLYYGVYTQGLVKFEDERKIFSSSLQGLSLTLLAVWTAVYLVFHQFWNQLFELTTVQMLAMLVIIWATAVFGFWSSEQRVELKYRKLITVTILTSIAKPVIGIVFVIFADDKVTARILGLVLVEIIAYLGLFLAQMKKGKVFFSKKYWKYALFFNLPLIPHYLANTVLNSADRIMIGKMVGSSEAGIYNLAYSISQIMTLFNTSLRQTLEPWMYKKIKDGKYMDIKNIAYPALIGIGALNILLIALAPEVTAIFAPNSYYDAIWLIPPVAMSVYFTFAYGFFAVYEFYFEKTSYVSTATMAGAILNIVLNYICIKIWGYYAAGYTTLVCYMLYAVCHYYYMNKICKDKLNEIKPFNSRILLLITCLFMGLGFLFLVTYYNRVLRYSLIVVLLMTACFKRRIIVDNVKSIISIKNAKVKTKEN